MLLRRLHDPDLILVDARPAGDFDALRIPGSIQVPIHALRTKRFLRDKDLVLVNRGLSQRLLLAQAERLKSSGFRSVQVLDGGMLGWYAAGGAVEGEPRQPRDLCLVAPGDLYSAMREERVVVIDVSATVPAVVPSSIAIPFLDGGTRFASEFRSMLERLPRDGSTALIVVSGDGSENRAMEKLIGDSVRLSAAPTVVYYLAGGKKEYRRFLQRASLAQQRQSVLKTPGCPSCR